MPLAWYVVPYKRRNPGGVPPERYVAMDDFTVQINADGGKWAETEILGDAALVKVNAAQATLKTLDGQPGWLAIPKRFNNLADGLTDLQNGEKNQIENALRFLGYLQAEIDAAMGSSLALWRQKPLETLLDLFATRRLKPRYDQPTDTIVCDGPTQPVKSVNLVAASVV